MPTNLGLRADLAAIKALPKDSPLWFPMVAAFLRKLFHSSVNRFGPNAVIDELAAGSGLPIGSILAFAAGGGGGQPAPGFIRCDGQSLSRETYSDLFKVVGTRFGAANSGLFSVPDLRRRMIIGRSKAFPDGSRSGREVHVVSINELPTHRHGTSSMTVSERPAHGHSHQYVYGKNEFPVLEGGAVAVIGPTPEMHAVPDGTVGWRFIPGNPNDFSAGRSGTPTKAFTGSDGAHGHGMVGAVTNAEGGGNPINMMGPSMVLDWAIWTGRSS